MKRTHTIVFLLTSLLFLSLMIIPSFLIQYFKREKWLKDCKLSNSIIVKNKDRYCDCVISKVDVVNFEPSDHLLYYSNILKCFSEANEADSSYLNKLDSFLNHFRCDSKLDTVFLKQKDNFISFTVVRLKDFDKRNYLLMYKFTYLNKVYTSYFVTDKKSAGDWVLVMFYDEMPNITRVLPLFNVPDSLKNNVNQIFDTIPLN